jgi:hypothetical protein
MLRLIAGYDFGTAGFEFQILATTIGSVSIFSRVDAQLRCVKKKLVSRIRPSITLLLRALVAVSAE